MRILLFLLLSFSVNAAVIVGDLRDITGQTCSPLVRFIPLNTPLASGTRTILDAPRSVQATNGAFVITLMGGYYNTDFGAPNKPVKILVPPDDTNTYSFNYVAALATNLNAFSYTNALDLVYLRRPTGAASGAVLTATDTDGHCAWLPLASSGGGETNTASNVGTGVGIFQTKVGSDLRLRSLAVAGGAKIGSDGDTITIEAPTTNGLVTQVEINASYNALQAAALTQTLTTSNQLRSRIDVVAADSITSVGLSVPAEFIVSGSPLTASGTLSLSKANQTANTVYAGPASGGAVAPGFRTLVAADIPALTLSKISDAGSLAGKSTATETDLSLSDNTTGNVSSSRHGLAPKAPGDATRFLDGSGAWSVPPVGGSLVIPANMTYYVRTDGNDGNNGRANTPAGAWLTINRAVEFVTTNLAVASGVAVTIQLGDGTYNESVSLTDFPGRGVVKITGNSATPANVVVNGPSTPAFLVTGKRWYLSNLKASSAGSSAVAVFDGGVLTLEGGLVFGSVAANNYHLFCHNGGVCWITQSYSIAAGAANHWRAERCGTIINSGGFTVTIQNSPNFTEAFAVGNAGGNICTYGVTFSGTVTGKRYLSVNNAVVNTFGSGTSYFPGNVAGTTANGGQYN